MMGHLALSPWRVLEDDVRMNSTDTWAPATELQQVRRQLERLVWCREDWSIENSREYDELAERERELIAATRRSCDPVVVVA